MRSESTDARISSSGALELNTATTRRQLYDRARCAMISNLEAAIPPFWGAGVAAGFGLVRLSRLGHDVPWAKA
jgi:hypothetical protein